MPNNTEGSSVDFDSVFLFLSVSFQMNSSHTKFFLFRFDKILPHSKFHHSDYVSKFFLLEADKRRILNENI